MCVCVCVYVCVCVCVLEWFQISRIVIIFLWVGLCVLSFFLYVCDVVWFEIYR